MVEGNLYFRSDGKRECLACKRARNRGRKNGLVLEVRGVLESKGSKIVPKVQSPDQPRRDDFRFEEASEPRLCPECDSVLVEKRGKLGCSDPSCPMYGQEQKGRV